MGYAVRAMTWSKRKWLWRLLAIPAGALLALLLAEGAARLYTPPGGADLFFNSPEAVPRGLYVTSPGLLLEPSRNFSGKARVLGRGVPLRTNALGLRGGPVQTSGPPRGWLTVGDSFTMALQVTEEETWQGRLTRRTGTPFYNGGVDGYSTWQATTRYRRLVDQGLRPRGVLLLYFLGNDLADNRHFPVIISQGGPNEAGLPVPKYPAPAWRVLLLGHSFIYAHYKVWRTSRDPAGEVPHFHKRWREELSLFTRPGAGLLRDLSGHTERALQQLAAETHRRGHTLMVAVAPPAFQLQPEKAEGTFRSLGLDPGAADLDAPARAVLQLLSRLGIQACDLTPDLRAGIARGEALYFNFDGHWTADGHRVVADTVAACLNSRKPGR